MKKTHLPKYSVNAFFRLNDKQVTILTKKAYCLAFNFLITAFSFLNFKKHSYVIIHF